MVGHQARGAKFLLAKLRVLVNVLALGDELLFDGGGASADFRFEVVTVSRQNRRCTQTHPEGQDKEKERRCGIHVCH
jgi:hypothetical protein